MMCRTVLTVALATVLAPAAAFAQQRPPSPVEAEPVVRQDVAPRRSFVGTVRATQSAVLGAEAAGRVVEIAAREGDHVKQGDMVARLRTTTIEIDVRAAEAELQLRREELRELRNGARAEELEQAESRFAATESELEFAKWDKESADELSKTGSISEDELRRVRLRLWVAEQLHAQSKAALELLRAGPREERIAQAAARVAAQEAAVERLKDQLDRHSVRAPFDGVVVAERTEVGEWLSVGDPVVDVVSLGEVEVRVGVVEDQVGGLRKGSRAVVTVGALPGREFEGKVHAVVPRGDERTRTFPVDVRVPNPTENGNNPLKPGMFARVSLEIGAPRPATLVPKDAIVLGGPAPMVHVVVPGAEGAPATTRPVPVRTGVALDGMIAVEAELQPGDLVVTRGNERVRPGQQIVVTNQGKPAAPAPEDAGE
jgi:RND family efflux transporter MFP subunit